LNGGNKLQTRAIFGSVAIGLYWGRRTSATPTKRSSMKKNILRSAAIAVALVLGAAIAMPSVAMPTTAQSISVFASTTSLTTSLSVPATYGPVIGHGFTEFSGNTQSQGSNPCDPITPQNWCSCGGCSGS